jgi:putative ABC transport system permease protein
METLRQDLRHALRLFLRQPLLVAVIAATLAIGISANVIVFSFVNGVLLRPFPFRDPARLLALREASAQRDGAVSYPNYADWAAAAGSFSSMAAAHVEEFGLSAHGAPERVIGARVTETLFATLGVSPILGRTLPPSTDAAAHGVVVIGEGLWVRRFGGDPAVVGRSLIVDGAPATVVGVMASGFHFPGNAELWMPLDEGPAQRRGDRHLSVVARLRDGVTLSAARAEMTAIAARLQQAYPQENRGMTARVLPLRDLYVREGRSLLAVLGAAVAFVLAIACMNVANLLLARGAERQAELAVRAALGAATSRLIQQLLTESLLLALLGGAVGLILAKAGVDVLLASIPVALPFWLKIQIDVPVLVFTVATSLLAGLAFGAVPALQAARPDLNTILKDHGRGPSSSARARRARSVLVAGEIAFSVALLSGAGLLIHTFLGLQRVDPGFDVDNLLTAQLAPVPESRYPDGPAVAAFYARVLDEIGHRSGVTAAAANSQIPLQQAGGQETAALTEGGAAETAFNANVQVVTPRYFEALGIPVARGREFEAADGGRAPLVAAVNERLAAQKWPGLDPLGRRLSLSGPQGPWLSVVGVVGNVRHRGLGREAMLDVYVPHAQNPRRGMTLVVRSAGAPASLADVVRAACADVDRDQPVDRVRTMREVVRNSLWVQRFAARLVGTFAVAAALLAAIGLSGVISYSVTQRTPEIGLRLALGATPADVVALVLRQALGIVGAGVAVGLALAVATALGLSSLLSNVRATNIPVLLGVSSLVVAVSLIACYLPARRAAAVDPIVGLKRE